jgi:DNA-directed RNA polymerase sigma subunit (sigma70/sigma32)
LSSSVAKSFFVCILAIATNLSQGRTAVTERTVQEVQQEMFAAADERGKRVVAMREEGMTWQDIGDFFEVSRQRAQQIYQSYREKRQA